MAISFRCETGLFCLARRLPVKRPAQKEKETACDELAASLSSKCCGAKCCFPVKRPEARAYSAHIFKFLKIIIFLNG
jgi:hypothetical protein